MLVMFISINSKGLQQFMFAYTIKNQTKKIETAVSKIKGWFTFLWIVSGLFTNSLTKKNFQLQSKLMACEFLLQLHKNRIKVN